MTVPSVYSSNGAGANSPYTTSNYSSVSVNEVSLPAGGGVVLFSVFTTAAAATAPTVTSITGAGLNFQRLAGPQQFTAVAPAGTGSVVLELWWAYSPAAFTTSTVFTVNISPASKGTTTDTNVIAITVVGCGNPAAPWDTTIGLPAALVGPAPQTLTFNIAQQSGIEFYDTSADGSVIYYADALVGTNGDELLVLAAASTMTIAAGAFSPDSVPHTFGVGSGSPWGESTGHSGGTPAFASHSLYVGGPPPPPPPDPTSLFPQICIST